MICVVRSANKHFLKRIVALKRLFCCSSNHKNSYLPIGAKSAVLNEF